MSGSVDPWAIAQKAAEGTPIPPAVLASLFRTESSGDPSARNRSSSAYGLGGVLPSTAARPGYNLQPLRPDATPEEQAAFSAQYLAARGREAGLTSPNDWRDPAKVSQALAAYHGPSTDANGVDGQTYGRMVMSGSNAAAAGLGTGGYGPGMVASTLGAVNTEQARKQAAQAPVIQQMQEDYQRDRATFDKVAKDYKPFEPTPAPTTPQTDPLKAFGSFAGIFATIAAGFTHTPAIAAMNGLAGAINAAKDSDWKTYQTQYNQWKDSTDIALQNHRLQAEDMKNALEAMKTDLTTGTAMAKAVVAQNDDKIGMKLLELGQYKELAELMQHRDAAAAGAQKSALQIEELHGKLIEQKPLIDASKGLTAAASELEKARASNDPAQLAQAQQAYQQAQDHYTTVAHGKPATESTQKAADETAIAVGQFKQLHEGRSPGPDDAAELATLRTAARPGATTNPDDVKNTAALIANYQAAPLTGYALRTPFGQAVMSQITQINPDYQATEYGARSKAARDFATGKQGQAINSFNVAISHLDTLAQLSDALANRDTTAINRLSNLFTTQFGGAAPTNFEAAKQIVGQEIIKAIVGGGGGVAEREAAGQKLLAASSPEQLRGVIETYKDLMGGQLKGLKQQYEQTTGLKNFNERLTAEARAQLEGRKGGNPAAPDDRAAPTVPQSLAGKKVQWSPSLKQFRDENGILYQPDGSRAY